MFNKKEYNKQYRTNNKDIMKQYRISNKEKAREYSLTHKKEHNEYQRNRLRTDLKFNLNRRVGSAIGDSLKNNKNGRHWESLVRYTLIDLIKRLEKTMPEGYTWEDCLNGRLHIDHIIPKSVFNFTKPEHIDFKRCWALGNLRLLTAKEN